MITNFPKYIVARLVPKIESFFKKQKNWGV